jgi:hypothetical protein
MQRFKIDDLNNINDFPEFNHIEQRVTKVELCFIDGSVKEAKLYFPFFTLSSEASEITNVYLSALINHWTRYWLKIKSYKIALGCVYKNGTEEYNVSYSPEEIPVDKVYIQDWPGGKWVDPVQHEKQQRKARVKSMVKHMKNGKHPLDGSDIKESRFPSYLN